MNLNSKLALHVQVPPLFGCDTCRCDRLPLTVTKKLQRVGMAARLGLPEIADSTPAQQRLFEATCPPGHSSPQQPVPCAPVSLDAGASHDPFMKNSSKHVPCESTVHLKAIHRAENTYRAKFFLTPARIKFIERWLLQQCEEPFVLRLCLSSTSA